MTPAFLKFEDPLSAGKAWSGEPERLVSAPALCCEPGHSPSSRWTEGVCVQGVLPPVGSSPPGLPGLLCGWDEIKWAGSHIPSNPRCLPCQSHQRPNKTRHCFLPWISLKILILACQTEKLFFSPYGGRRTGKRACSLVRQQRCLPHSPARQPGWETQGKTQMREIHLFAFNLRLKFPALDNGELHSSMQNQDEGDGGVITACEVQ